VKELHRFTVEPCECHDIDAKTKIGSTIAMTGNPDRLSGMKKLLCLAMLAACGGGDDS
jgi:hypothetical protein